MRTESDRMAADKICPGHADCGFSESTEKGYCSEGKADCQVAEIIARAMETERRAATALRGAVELVLEGMAGRFPTEDEPLAKWSGMLDNAFKKGAQ